MDIKEVKKLKVLSQLKDDSELAIFDYINDIEVSLGLYVAGKNEEVNKAVQNLKEKVAEYKKTIPDYTVILASLKGTKGDKGEVGIQGEEGKIGPKGEKGDAPIKSKDYFTEQEKQEFLKKITPVKGKDYFDGENGADGIDGKIPVKNIDYFDGKDGEIGPMGPIGPAPKHEWQGTMLRFQNPDGTWGKWVNLRATEKMGGGGLVIKGGAGGTFVYNETPTGAVDSANVTYTLAHAPSPAGSLILTVNGQVMTSGGVDYTLSGSTITMVTAPPTTSVIRAISYVY